MLSPANGVWTDLSVLKLSTPSMIKLENGTMSIPEGTQIDAQKLVVGTGGKLLTEPTSSSWALKGKTVEVEKGGRLEISMANENFATGLNFANVSGAGKLVYVSKSAEIVDIPNKPYDPSLELVLSGGKFAAESYLVRHIRFTFLEPNGGNAKLARVKIFDQGGSDVNLTQGAITTSGASSLLVSRSSLPSDFLMFIDKSWIATISPKADRSSYLDVQLTNPMAMFKQFGYVNGLSQDNQPLRAFDVSVSYDGVHYIPVGSVSSGIPTGDQASARWPASLPLATDVPGVTVERGAQLVYRDGSGVVEERVSRVPKMLFR